MTEQQTPPSPVRQGFQNALDQLHQAPMELDWRPAFMTSVRALHIAQRRPLPEAPATPPHRPFAGQAFSLTEASQRIAAGSLSAQQLVEIALANVQQREAALNAFVYVDSAESLYDQAAQLDHELAQGQRRGPLHGITIAVKDVISVAGMPDTASSPVLADRIAARDAESVRLLREAGAIIVGKAHTHEFALGVTTPQSRNPWDETRDPGGSSGGSAIAVATGMSLGAMATDTRASVRVPAALCGVVGYKPTYDLVSTAGMTTLSWSLDHCSPMGATVEDIALLLNTIAPTRPEDYTRALHRDVRGLRVGLATAALEDADADVLSAFDNAVSALESLGVEVIPTDTPTADDLDEAVLLGLLISRSEAAAYHTAFAERKHLYQWPVVPEQLDEAGRILAVDYLQAQRRREHLRQRMFAHMHNFDAILMPTARVTAPKSSESDKYFLVLSQNCIIWSFIGFPTLSLPCGLTPAGLPVGAQLTAGPMEDGRLLSLAHALEGALLGQ